LPSSYFIGKIVLIFSILFSLLLYGGLYQQAGLLKHLSFYLILICLVVSILTNNLKKYFYIFLSVYAILGLFMIISSPEPKIDVFFMLKEGALNFVNGKNPYNMIFTKIPGGIYNSYAYFPGMIIVTSPIVLIFNDPRYLILFCQLGTSLLFYKGLNSISISIIFLFNPLGLFILEQSWTDAIIFFFVSLFVYLILKKRFLFSALIFGFALSLKQYVILFIPMFWFFIRGRYKYLFTAFLIAALLVFPFIIWDFQKFYYGAVGIQTSLPFRRDGLTIISLFYNEFSLNIPFPFLPIVWFTILIAVYYKINSSNYYIIAIKTFIFIFLFFFINKWAFANYYYLLSSMFLFSILLKEKEKN